MKKWIRVDKLHRIVRDYLDKDEVRQLVDEAYNRGHFMKEPAIIVIPGKRGHYIVVDGRHRSIAAEKLGLEYIWANVIPKSKWYPMFDPVWFKKEVLDRAHIKGLL